MPTKLDSKSIANLKPRAKAFYVNDAFITGLALRVAPKGPKNPEGKKSWSVRYRFNGQQWRYALGALPEVSLADARAAASAALNLVNAVPPVNPAALKAARREAAEQAKRDSIDAAERAKRDSIEVLCESYIEGYAKPRKRTWRADHGKLKNDVLTVWKGRPVPSITRKDCRALVQGIADRGAPIVANRVAALLSRLFRFAVDAEIIELNPAAHLPKPGVERASRPEGECEQKAYTADEVRTIWQATEALDPTPRALYRLGLITGQRPTEISDLEWREIDGSWWTIPALRTKNNREHRVFLTQSALDLLADVPRADDATYVFPGYRGKRQLAELNAIVFADVRRRDMPRHALRDTAATGLAKAGVAVEHISRVLNHAVGKRVTAGYNSYAYDREKRLAMLKWSRVLTSILEQKTADVLAFKRA